MMKIKRFWNYSPIRSVYAPWEFLRGVSVIMAIIVVVGGLLAGAAIFAALKNTSKSRESKVTKLDIG
jgi:hypothetical protein